MDGYVLGQISLNPKYLMGKLQNFSNKYYEQVKNVTFTTMT